MSEFVDLRTVAEYKGEAAISVEATQLPMSVTKAEARKIVDEWIDFFSAGPTPVRKLSFKSRTPKRLFDSLSSQTQLKVLLVKWGDYQNLETLSGMSDLETLVLRGASSVRSLQPLTSLQNVSRLEVNSHYRVRDVSPIAKMNAVTDLTLGGGLSRVAHLDSIGFLRSMPQLETLRLQAAIVDDKDYSPLFDMRGLKDVWVMECRGMRPPIKTLVETLPWSGYRHGH